MFSNFEYGKICRIDGLFAKAVCKNKVVNLGEKWLTWVTLTIYCISLNLTHVIFPILGKRITLHERRLANSTPNLPAWNWNFNHEAHFNGKFRIWTVLTTERASSTKRKRSNLLIIDITHYFRKEKGPLPILALFYYKEVLPPFENCNLFYYNWRFLRKFVYFLVAKIALWHKFKSSWKSNWPKWCKKIQK